ncbi:hypothetical protein C8F01DRAFT_1255483 [Mycena amicta]|nr:hypothetical protein C8F01DRAFT_1255483 [Mycena amicta]
MLPSTLSFSVLIDCAVPNATLASTPRKRRKQGSQVSSTQAPVQQPEQQSLHRHLLDIQVSAALRPIPPDEWPRTQWTMDAHGWTVSTKRVLRDEPQASEHKSTTQTSTFSGLLSLSARNEGCFP